MKKGFTLTELLAVIIVLSLLTLVTATIVASIVKSGKNKINKTQEQLIVKAAELWYQDNREYLPEKNSCTYVTLQTLKADGVLDDEVYNIETLDLLDNSNKVKVTAKTGSSGKVVYKYEYNPRNIAGCINAANSSVAQYTLMPGLNFNLAVKSLASGTTVTSPFTVDDTVEHIDFYSNGDAEIIDSRGSREQPPIEGLEPAEEIMMYLCEKIAHNRFSSPQEA